jgi:hypothetical protein
MVLQLTVLVFGGGLKPTHHANVASLGKNPFFRHDSVLRVDRLLVFIL